MFHVFLIRKCFLYHGEGNFDLENHSSGLAVDPHEKKCMKNALRSNGFTMRVEPDLVFLRDTACFSNEIGGAGYLARAEFCQIFCQVWSATVNFISKH